MDQQGSLLEPREPRTIARRRSDAARSLALVVAVAFLLDLSIMVLFSSASSPGITIYQAVLFSILFVAVLCPVLYFFVYHPFFHKAGEHAKVQETLAESEEKYRDLFEQANDSIFVADSQTRRFLYGNENAYGRLGYTREEFLQLTVDDIVAAAVAPMTESVFQALKTNDNLTFETCHKRKDGTEISVEVSVRTIDYAGRPCHLAFLRDIRKRKQAEDLFRGLTSSSPIGIYIVQDGKFQFVNPQFQKSCGYDEKELLGTESLDIILPEDRELVRENAVQMLKGDRSSPFEYRIVTKSGEIRWILETVASIQFRRGKAAVGSFMDISERKRMEEELRQSLEKTARSRSLQLALSQATHAVQSATTPDEVYQAVLEHVAAMGYHALIFTLTEDRTQLALAHCTFRGALLQAAEKLAGVAAKGYRMPLVPGSIYQRIIDNAETIFSDPVTEAIREALPQQTRFGAGTIANLIGLKQGIIAPLMSGSSTAGILIVAGNGLTEAEIPAIGAFANQIDIAIEKALLFHKTRELAITDGLTGLHNHRHFYELLEAEEKRVRRYKRPMSLLMIDIDYFKMVNDSYGHQAGDRVLKSLAEVLRHCVRDTDHLARYGGEEFAVILPETQGAEAVALAERIRSSVEDHGFEIESERIKLTLSIGVASFALKEENTNGLVHRADQALYEAKHHGRNQIQTQLRPDPVM